jgi:hypothetical protein
VSTASGAIHSFGKMAVTSSWGAVISGSESEKPSTLIAAVGWALYRRNRESESGGIKVTKVRNHALLLLALYNDASIN